MIREIKFRAWDEENKNMFNWKEVLKNFELSDLIKWETCGTEIMQYICLKDKNGKEIYEGDLVKNRFGIVFEVKPLEERLNFMFVCPAGKYKGIVSQGNRTQKFCEPDEIIGNIYENPDLIKK